ncbi:MAG: ATP-binding cassette domain-containing protein, partial [Candidatus Limnocylindrales bacterium]|nr:ATP-binding cassette domain-containing protein [Candidatus Limnocylindrales bacterium]
ELSGGERQRIALARAIALRPDLLVADEPTSMLDASRQTEFLALIRGLRTGRQMSLVYITHDLALAAAACDRIVVLDAGRVVEAGPTADVVSRPRASVTRALVAAVRARASAVSGVRGDRPTIQVPSPG